MRERLQSIFMDFTQFIHTVSEELTTIIVKCTTSTCTVSLKNQKPTVHVGKWRCLQEMSEDSFGD